MLRTALIAVSLAMVGCAALKKDNEPKSPIEKRQDVSDQLGVYRPLIGAQADAYGLMVMGGSIGDSALFSCLARVAGAADFDPAVLFRDGKPVRHPDIQPSAALNSKGSRGTPISKDMVNGVMWCIYDLIRHGDKDQATDLLSQMISFGKSHKLTLGADLGWLYCTEQERLDYLITDEDWFGKCFMPPAVIKDIYRLAKAAGMDCDTDCQFYSTIGANVPADKDGFERHLAVLTTVRNGLVDGAINDNSLRTVLSNAATAQPRNGLYLASFHLYNDGDQAATFAALGDTSLFPTDKLPTAANYCTDYLFQRDDDSASGREKPDWLPCGDSTPDGRGIEWALAAALSLGEVH